MQGKRVHRVLSKHEFGPFFGPSLITVNDKKDFAERIVAIDWSQIGLETILHGTIQCYVGKYDENQNNRYCAKNGIYYSYQPKKIVVIERLEEEQIPVYRDRFQALLNLR